MPFNCPDAADLVNACSLNRAFLLLLRDRAQCRRWLGPLHEDLIARITTLSLQQIERLSDAPFLLLSIHERDDRLWQSLLRDQQCNDLFTSLPGVIDSAGRLTAATLGFAWQLSKQNPYTARLICGASLHWCELLAEQTLYRVLAAAATRNDLLQLRSPSDLQLWSKLLGSGVSRDKQVRSAAHLTALGMLMRNSLPAQRDTWASAACRSRLPLRSTSGDPAANN